MYKIIRVVILMLITSNVQAQSNPWKITKNDLAIMATQAIAGAADAFNQKIAHHHFGQGNQFWDYDVSWKNKYKDFDGGNKDAAFIGSKTIFVGFTDGYHMTRSIERIANIATIVISSGELKKYAKKDYWKVILKKAIVSLVPNRGIFTLIFK